MFAKVRRCTMATGGFLKGADVSFIPMIEDHGGEFREGGLKKDCLRIFRDNGFDFMRLRVWNDPTDGYCGREKTLEMARRIKELGFGLLLDFHYSDWWADPAKQTKPKAWRTFSFTQLETAVHDFTKGFLRDLALQKTSPDMVQVGNEIIHGMLWDDGKVDGAFDTEAQWDRLAVLIKAGVAAVKNSEVMIHIDRGGDNEGSRYFLDKLSSRGVEFDVLGLSFYPLWHGTLGALKANLDDLAVRYGKDIVVVECAYPFTLEYSDGSGRVRDPKWVLEGYEPTPLGQHLYLRDLIGIVKGAARGRGTGVFYWAPEWFSSRSWKRKPTGEQDWDYLSLFDFDGNALESFQAFREA
jgi:arabinogalactan endo-1,4-beta-galactosidase